MKTNPKALREARVAIVAEQRAILDAAEAESRGMNAEERAKYDTLEAKDSDLIKRISDVEAQERKARELAEATHKKEEEVRANGEEGNAETAKEKAFDAYLRYGMSQLSAEERSILNGMVGSLPEQRAQSIGTTTAGGYLIPRGFSGELETALKEYGGMLSAARIWNTSTGNTVDWPTVDDTGNKGRLLAENADAATGSTDVVFGQKTIGAYTFTSDLIKVSNQLLQDSDFDLTSFLVEALSERLGRSINQYMTTGTGSSQPEGVVTNSVKGVDALVSALSFDNMIDLLHSVNSAYRKSPQAAFMFNDNTLKVLRKLKDGEGRYIWQMGDVRTGSPDTILGKSFVINDDMADVGVSTKPAIFGDFRRFIIRQTQQPIIRRLDERFADLNQTAFVGFMRLDGKLLNTAAIKHILNAAS